MTALGFASPFALERFRHLQPHLEDDVPLARIAVTSAIPERTLRRWLARYHAEGVAGLERKARADRGQRRKIAPELEAMLRSQLVKRPRPVLTAIHRRICLVAAERGLAAPSYGVAADIARKIDPAVAALPNPAQYRDRHELVHRRQAAAPNEMWQADHTPLDIMILDASGAPQRPWLTTVIDDHSRVLAGYFMSLDVPSAMNTALALRQAIWRKTDPRWIVCGIPDQLYVDNGADFTSEHIMQACIALKIRLLHSRPGRPRGRGRIERLFRTINDMFLPDLPGHLINGKPLSPPGLDLPTLAARFEMFLHTVYHVRQHGGVGEAPLRRWQADGFLPRLPDSRDALDMLLLRAPTTRKVLRDGIRFKGLRYVEPTLAAFIGETVEVLYDPRDLAEIHVYHEGRFVCRGLSPEHADAPDVAALQRANRLVRTGIRREFAADKVVLDPGAERPPVRQLRRLKLYADED